MNTRGRAAGRSLRPRGAALFAGLIGSVTVLGLTACSTGTDTGGSVGSTSAGSSPSSVIMSASSPSATAAALGTAGATSGTRPPSGSSPAALDAPGTGSLRGRVILIDPGHNGGNGRHTAQIARKVAIGNGVKACDTTGTQTNAGYPESAFTFDVATRLAVRLRAEGATVVLTRPDNRGVGPCINERAAGGNRVHADAAISIHGDGAAASGYGFHVIVPRGIGSNDAIVTPSRRLGIDVRDAFRAGAGEPLSTYSGTTTDGLVTRSDLGGLNLSTVPKVFIECGNMRNATDARRMTDPTWRQRAANALAVGLARFVTSTPPAP